MLDSLSHFWKKTPPASEIGQIASLQALLPVPNGSLEHELAIGSLAFVKEEYHIARGLLIDLDAADDTHALLEAFKRLSLAPVKTRVVLLHGRESTYARKEEALFGIRSYVALYWNYNEEGAVEQLRTALGNVEHWMRGKRTSRYPSLPVPVVKRSSVMPGSGLKKPEMSLIKTAKPVLNFSADALKKRSPKK